MSPMHGQPKSGPLPKTREAARMCCRGMALWGKAGQ